MRESLAQEAARITAEAICICGKVKQPGKPFCIFCFRRMPQSVTAKLRPGDPIKFAEGFDECREWLRDN